MTGDDRDAGGVAPRFAALIDTILEADEVPMQVVHRKKRGGYGARCGDTLGQVSPLGTGVTCVRCEEPKKRKKT